MKQLAFLFSLVLTGGLLLISCRSRPYPVESKEKTIYKTETVKDTVLVVKKDSSYYKAYIDCVNGKPVLVQSQKQITDYNTKNPDQKANTPKSVAGRTMKSPAVNLENGLLSVDCTKEAEKLFITWKEKYIQESLITSKPIYIDKPLTNFEQVKMTLGSVVVWLLVVLVVVFGLRFLISKKLF